MILDSLKHNNIIYLLKDGADDGRIFVDMDNNVLFSISYDLIVTDCKSLKIIGRMQLDNTTGCWILKFSDGRTFDTGISDRTYHWKKLMNAEIEMCKHLVGVLLK